MVRLCKENGLPEPTFSYRDGFVLTIARSTPENVDVSAESSGKMSWKMSWKTEGKTEGKKIGRTALRIIRLIKKHPQITMPEMAASLGVTESAVEKQIRKLREDEIIGRVGPAKGGHWEVLE